ALTFLISVSVGVSAFTPCISSCNMPKRAKASVSYDERNDRMSCEARFDVGVCGGCAGQKNSEQLFPVAIGLAGQVNDRNNRASHLGLMLIHDFANMFGKVPTFFEAEFA